MKSDPARQDELEHLVREEERRITIRRVRLTAAYVAVPLTIPFALFDWFLYPELSSLFLPIRLLTIPAAVITYIAYKSRIIRDRFHTLPGCFLLLFFSTYVVFMMRMTGGWSSDYADGLPLVASAAMALVPVSRRQLAVLFACVYGPYFVLALSGAQAEHAMQILTFCTFSVAYALLAGFVNYLNHALRRSEIELRHQLAREISTKEAIIAQKTKEGVFLERLASQFSPQVISAIKSGQIKLTDLVRQEITCIFIDIEDSTKRANKIDHVEYNSMVSDFFTDVIDILLEHDVTVGTYLGDGLLAFTNAPQASPRYAESAMQACLAILRRHHQKRKYYAERWRTQFNIRIGVNSGYASLGFFPNQHRGTYTALGSTVNLAARLCGRAVANSICVTKDQLKQIAESLPRAIVEPHAKSDDLKGFEGERYDLYSILPIHEPVEVTGSACPSCQRLLVPGRDLGSIVMMKCEACAYVDFVTKLAA